MDASHSEGLFKVNKNLHTALSKEEDCTLAKKKNYDFKRESTKEEAFSITTTNFHYIAVTLCH